MVKRWTYTGCDDPGSHGFEAREDGFFVAGFEYDALAARMAEARDLLGEVLHEHGHEITSQALLNDIDRWMECTTDSVPEVAEVSDHPVDERYEMSAELFALRAEVERLRGLLTKMAEWDQFNPPAGQPFMTGDHGYWKREIDAALGPAVQPSVKP